MGQAPAISVRPNQHHAHLPSGLNMTCVYSTNFGENLTCSTPLSRQIDSDRALRLCHALVLTHDVRKLTSQWSASTITRSSWSVTRTINTLEHNSSSLILSIWLHNVQLIYGIYCLGSWAGCLQQNFLELIWLTMGSEFRLKRLLEKTTVWFLSSKSAESFFRLRTSSNTTPCPCT